MRWIRLLALPLASLALAACEILGGPASFAAECAGPARSYAGIVVGSFNTTVGAIRGLEPIPVEPARWPDLAPDHQAVLCYIDSEIAKGPPPGPNGEIRDPFDRVVIGIVDGQTEMISAGYRDRLPVSAP